LGGRGENAFAMLAGGSLASEARPAWPLLASRCAGAHFGFVVFSEKRKNVRKGENAAGRKGDEPRAEREPSSGGSGARTRLCRRPGGRGVGAGLAQVNPGGRRGKGGRKEVAVAGELQQTVRDRKSI